MSALQLKNDLLKYIINIDDKTVLLKLLTYAKETAETPIVKEPIPVYAKGEVTEKVEVPEPKPWARFRGTLTSEEADELQEYVKKSREEWDRNF